MSFETVPCEIRINRDQLLDLFLGYGDLLIQLEGQKVTINKIKNHGIHNVVDGVDLFDIEIRGDSDKPSISYVDGTGTLTPIGNNESFKLSLKLQLQDQWE